MKFIMDVTVLCDNSTTFRKEFECEATPVPGMEIEDTAWHDARKISSVTLNPGEGSYYIVVEPESCTAQEELDGLKEMYKSHGWTVLGE